MARIVACFVIGLLFPGASLAATGPDKPLIAPPAAWVKPTALPADTAKPDEAAVKLLLQDQQIRLLPNGGDQYSETVMRVQTPQGLTALGTISLPWKPDTSTLTVHKLHIIRAGKVIDLLAGGAGFTVLRRENKLEYATLDGVLTAAIQPEGLQVGDLVDLALTVHTDDPALAGHTEGYFLVPPGQPAEHLRLRMIWDRRLPVRWRALDGLPKPVESKAGDLAEITLVTDGLKPLIPPKGAPPRFLLTRAVEATSYRGWDEFSAAFAPLYDKAATIRPDSPLKAEIARIAAASNDPATRAEAALKLVQEQVRYVFLGMNDGGLIPAGADLTWQRRFGDCKGKTALLLAMLHGLGIQAEPAIVSSALGDGMEQRLPMVGLFDHILVRATIGGQIYWLDGTRMGDRRLADIQVPPFRWALPLRPQGGALEPLVMKVPDKPLKEYRFRLDMRGGISGNLPFHVEEIARGDEATALHMQLENMAPDVRDRSLRDYMKANYKEATIATVTAAFDPATGDETLVMDGTVKHDWRYQTYEGDRAGLGEDDDISRPSGPHSDAPYQVAFPSYFRTIETILLPDKGKGFVVDAPTVNKTIAAIEFRRKGMIENGVFTLETSQRAIAREFPAKEAASAQAELAELHKTRAALRLSSGTMASGGHISSTALAALQHGLQANQLAINNDLKGALAAFDRAVRLDGRNGMLRLGRGLVYQRLERHAEARADFDKAIELAPNMAGPHLARAELVMRENQPAPALADLEKALALQPDNLQALFRRAQVEEALGQHEAALTDSAAVIARDPHKIDAYLLRANIFSRQHRIDEALAEGADVIAANPDADYAYVTAGAIYARLNKHPQAEQAFDRAIAIKPSVYVYLTRANNRPLDDVAGRRSDIEAALKLDPSDSEALAMARSQAMQEKDWAGAIAFADRGLSLKPNDMIILHVRGVAHLLAGQTELGMRDIAAARALAGTDPARLNELCWTKATFNVAIDSALAECDAALAKAPDRPDILDSRGFVLLRMGRDADAISAYDHALKVMPMLPESLYGRGIAKLRLGQTEAGKTDQAAATALDPRLPKRFASYGITA